MIDVEDLCDQMSKFFVSDLSLDIASPDTDLLNAGVLDSALIVEILLLLEQRFDLQIPVESLEVDDLRSIRSIARLIASNAKVS